ncbi:alpha/beta hydrolase [Paraburkholderia sp. RL17-347-BIC-D]|uniref:alpha/beta hydrolase n=1 Tax=Paraburkholderia sp. RL17-347-BIC-D TaxID=3031632 RepID=UPI0038BA0EEC
MTYSNEVQTALKHWIEAFVDLAPHLRGEPSAISIDAARAAYVEFLATNKPPADVVVENVRMGSIPGTLVVPERLQNDRVMLYLHGGGYFSGSPDGYHGIAGRYAKLLRARVYMPDYRLAPECPFPTPINDAFDSYRWLLEQGHDAKSIVFSGDSAGGAMVVSLMVAARTAGSPLPAGGVAISPWANLEHTGASMSNRNGIDPIVTKEALDLIARRFLNGALPNTPEASPVFADVRGLPPILIQIGENEVMLSDAMRLATHLAENRVRTSLEVWPNMFHVWPIFADILPDGAEALRNAARFLEDVLPH